MQASNPKIAFFDAKKYDQLSFDEKNGDFGFSIKYFKEHLNPDTAVLSKGFGTICAFVNDDISKATIDMLFDGGTKLIALRCAGYNNVDLLYAYGKIHIVRVPSYSPYAVAEHAVALIMSLNRKIHRAYYRTRDSNFSIFGFLGFDMNGKCAGIVGTGKIGCILSKILNGFGMKVLAYDPMPNADAARQYGFEYTDIDTLYSKSDIISLHCPLTKDTHHMINDATIGKMKPGVMLINTGRGQLIDTRALIAGLKSNHIGSAGLDVYEEESQYFFEDFSNTVMSDDILARLLTFNNVLVTSHQGFFTREALSNIAHTTLQNIRDFYDGKPMDNSICYHQCKGGCRRKETGRCF